MLRTRSPRSEVTVSSQHMFGKAIDFYIPGVSLEKLRETAMQLQGGGVGYYPASGSPFVHLDVGNVSAWPRMTREQLVKLFPDGRTVHLPADGTPLRGYELARADIEHGVHHRAGAEPTKRSFPTSLSGSNKNGDSATIRETDAVARGASAGPTPWRPLPDGSQRRLSPGIRRRRLPHPLYPIRMDVASRIALLTRRCRACAPARGTHRI